MNNTCRKSTDMMNASISYWNEEFIGEHDFEIRLIANWFHLQARHDLNGVRRYISFKVSKDIPNDGSTVELPLVLDPQSKEQALGVYSRFPSAGGDILNSRSGTLTMSYDGENAQMKGDFHFEVRLGDQAVTISNGSFDLRGITDGVKHTAGTGFFTAASEWGSFNAHQVSIESKELPFDPVGYWEVVGRMNMDDAIPPTQSHIALFIKKNVSGSEHDLTNNANVWVTYFRPLNGGFFSAMNGTLTFDALPETGHAKGTLVAGFKDGDKSVEVKGAFDINDDASKH